MSEYKLFPVNAARNPPMTPFFMITRYGKHHAIDRNTARDYWDKVPESRGRILFEDDKGRHVWDGPDARP